MALIDRGNRGDGVAKPSEEAVIRNTLKPVKPAMVRLTLGKFVSLECLFEWMGAGFSM